MLNSILHIASNLSNPQTEGNQQTGGNPFSLMLSSSVLVRLEGNINTFNSLFGSSNEQLERIRDLKCRVAVHTSHILENPEDEDNVVLNRQIGRYLNELVELGCTSAVAKFGLVGYWT